MPSVQLDSQIKEIQQKYKIVGRTDEIRKILLAFYSGKHILIEGEIGTSKTTLARAFAAFMDKNFFRVDGSEDVLSHVLVGYFDPPQVLAKGYGENAFIFGPLSDAMKRGGVLFINELNRLPESTQNVLLSALDDGYLNVPKLAPIKSKDGFIVITTMNPSAHVGVTSLGEALKDRFVWIKVDYQSEAEEIEIIKLKLDELLSKHNLTIEDSIKNYISVISTRIIRATRKHESLRRGASIRGGIDMAALVLMHSNYDKPIKEDEQFWFSAAYMALSTKIELEDGADTNVKAVIDQIVGAILKDFQ